jgi:hypothetical protein
MFAFVARQLAYVGEANLFTQGESWNETAPLSLFSKFYTAVQ